MLSSLSDYFRTCAMILSIVVFFFQIMFSPSWAVISIIMRESLGISYNDLDYMMMMMMIVFPNFTVVPR